MATNNIEIEIQVTVEDTKDLLSFLESQGTFQWEKQQIDEYFSPTSNNFLDVRPVKEWLRLRNAGGTCSVNYKNWHYDENGKSNHCDEYETKVENSDQMKHILTALGYTSIAIVDKIRKTWLYNDYEIALDSVKNLGEFVEIEYVGKDTEVDPKKIADEMVEFLKEHNCGKIEKNYVGYPFLILFPEEGKYETQ